MGHPYQNIWNEVQVQLVERMTNGTFKKKQILHGKLKTMKERIKTNLDGQDVSYDMYCNTTAVFKVYSVYK